MSDHEHESQIQSPTTEACPKRHDVGEHHERLRASGLHRAQSVKKTGYVLRGVERSAGGLARSSVCNGHEGHWRGLRSSSLVHTDLPRFSRMSSRSSTRVHSVGRPERFQTIPGGLRAAPRDFPPLSAVGSAWRAPQDEHVRLYVVVAAQEPVRARVCYECAKARAAHRSSSPAEPRRRCDRMARQYEHDPKAQACDNRCATPHRGRQAPVGAGFSFNGFSCWSASAGGGACAPEQEVARSSRAGPTLRNFRPTVSYRQAGRFVFSTIPARGVGSLLALAERRRVYRD
jgi:hypothetical protein